MVSTAGSPGQIALPSSNHHGSQAIAHYIDTGPRMSIKASIRGRQDRSSGKWEHGRRRQQHTRVARGTPAYSFAVA